MRTVIRSQGDSLSHRNILALTIEVTDKHISSGSACNDDYCPIALALMEKLNYHGIKAGISVGHTNIDVYTYNDEVYSTSTPQEMEEFITAFDSRLPVKPFSSTLLFERTIV